MGRRRWQPHGTVPEVLSSTRAQSMRTHGTRASTRRWSTTRRTRSCFKFKPGATPQSIMQNTARSSTHRTLGSDATTYRSTNSDATGAGFEKTIGELRGFNSSLKDELSELKGYVMQTQQRLGQLESMMDEDGASTGRSSAQRSARSGYASSRSKSTSRTARSDASSVLSAARSAIQRSKSRQGGKF